MQFVCILQTHSVTLYYKGLLKHACMQTCLSGLAWAATSLFLHAPTH